MTVMPSDSHLARCASNSMMFVFFKYSTGRAPRSPTVAVRRAVGEDFCLPAANQSLSSAIQKSGSSWMAITNLSVIIISFVADIILSPRVVKNSIVSKSGVVSVDASGGVSSDGSSKLISVKTGADTFTKFSPGAPASGVVSPKSKSVGNGKSVMSSGVADGVAVAPPVGTISGTGTTAGAAGDVISALNADTGGGHACPRARRNGPRNSRGRWSSNGGASGIGASVDVESAVLSSSTGAGAGAGLAFNRAKNAGRGILNSGALVRTIIVVVAI